MGPPPSRQTKRTARLLVCSPQWWGFWGVVLRWAYSASGGGEHGGSNSYPKW